jgi:hypothetical protein
LRNKKPATPLLNGAMRTRATRIQPDILSFSLPHVLVELPNDMTENYEFKEIIISLLN